MRPYGQCESLRRLRRSEVEEEEEEELFGKLLLYPLLPLRSSPLPPLTYGPGKRNVGGIGEGGEGGDKE